MPFSIHGVHVPHRKNTQNKPVAKMDVPKTLTFPMSMHIGAPATPIVKVGDEVKVGTKIAEAGGAVSAPIHASVSGKVTAIRDYLLSNGAVGKAVVIESDGEMTPDENIVPPVIDSKESLVAAVRESGIVGLGGAGFPTHVKLNVEPGKIEQLVINGAECEPYITSDSHTMVTRRDDMAYALKILMEILQIKSVVIGVESNKKEAIASMKILARELSDHGEVAVKVLPSIYPQGGEKVLVYNTTGKIIPIGKLPLHVGCVILNSTTLATLGSYFKTGMPLVEKCVTVDGGAVTAPQNVMVPVGTSMEDVFAACGGFRAEPAKLLYGGPMMGISVPDTSAPVLKQTNAILALTEKEAKLPKTTACISCGSCTNACPFGLTPAAIARAYNRKDAEALEALNINACMECGCCSFVCPANRPLVQTNKLAKVLLREEKAKEGTKA